MKLGFALALSLASACQSRSPREVALDLASRAADESAVLPRSGSIVAVASGADLRACGDLFYLLRRIGRDQPGGRSLIIVTDEDSSVVRMRLGGRHLPIGVVTVSELESTDSAFLFVSTRQLPVDLAIGIADVRADPEAALNRLIHWAEKVDRPDSRGSAAPEGSSSPQR